MKKDKDSVLLCIILTFSSLILFTIGINFILSLPSVFPKLPSTLSDDTFRINFLSFLISYAITIIIYPFFPGSIFTKEKNGN